MRKVFVLLFVLISGLSAEAQFPGGGARLGGGMGGGANIGHLYGKVVDNTTNKGIESVTIQLLGNKFDTSTHKMKEVALGTMITKPNGNFSFENLPVMGKFKLKIGAIGYKSLEKPVSFDIKMPSPGGGMQSGGGMQQMLGMIDKDLGNIKLVQDATDLGNVTVTATVKQQFELGIDRKIFNVDKNLVSSGQTATEVMKSIPSLNVDIDGNVTMRNATPTLFIDGRPTTLTLD